MRHQSQRRTFEISPSTQTEWNRLSISLRRAVDSSLTVRMRRSGAGTRGAAADRFSSSNGNRLTPSAPR
jgi:hypothetical protein